jgi:hypothetical protein
MQTKVSYLSDLKFNLETWKRELRFHYHEMDTFQEKLEEIAAREFTKKALVPLETFQNRITIEKSAISKLMHRCKRKLSNVDRVDYGESIDGRLQYEQSSLRDDMKDYIRMHYELKESMMDYFLVWL